MKNMKSLVLSVVSIIVLIIIIGCNLNDSSSEEVNEKLVTLTIKVKGPQIISVEDAAILSSSADFKDQSGNIVTSVTINSSDFGVEKSITITEAQVNSIKSITLSTNWVINDNQVTSSSSEDISLSSGYHYVDITIIDVYDVGIIVDTGDPYSRTIKVSGNSRTLSTNSFAISDF